MNFDFLVENNTADTVSVSKIMVPVFEKHNHIINQGFLDNNGTASAIETLSNRSFTGKQKKLLFNPFSEFDQGIKKTCPANYGERFFVNGSPPRTFTSIRNGYQIL